MNLKGTRGKTATVLTWSDGDALDAKIYDQSDTRMFELMLSVTPKLVMTKAPFMTDYMGSLEVRPDFVADFCCAGDKVKVAEPGAAVSPFKKRKRADDETPAPAADAAADPVEFDF